MANYSANDLGSAFLMHYGILGMRWGVRRTQEQLGNYTGSRIKKGTEFNRITMNPNERNSGITYVSYTKRDNNFYNGVIAKYYKDNKKRDVYSQKLTSIQDIVTPSYKKQVSTFVKFYKNNTLDVAKEFSKNDYYDKHYRSPNKNSLEYKDLLKKYSELKDSDVKSNYRKFIVTASEKTDLHSKYFNELAKDGYNAIPDWNDKTDNDNGLPLYDKTDDPLIIFDRKTTLKKTSVSKLSDEEINNAANEYSKAVHPLNYTDKKRR